MNPQEMEQFKVQMMERASLFKKLTDRFGKEILTIVAEHTSNQIRDKLIQTDLETRNLDSVMELLWDRMGAGFEFQTVERNPQRLRIRVTRCFIAEEMRRLRATEIGLVFYCAYDYGFCSGLNPHIRFSRTKTLMNGDDCCNHAYELVRT